MFKRILIATDGSPLSRTAIETGVAMAKLTHGTVVGLHARPPTGVTLYGEASIRVPPESQSEFRARAKAASARHLAEVEAVAHRSEVPFEGVQIEDPSPSGAILRTAQAKGCDLIVMASHGHRGLTRLLLGSETQKVLTHATQTVIVTR